ncbi:hypothetical protein BLOT_016576 [Blomia tropicalis]|nr:hypothetical protein BLOT_016576 [Blomia tropicalis]
MKHNPDLKMKSKLWLLYLNDFHALLDLHLFAQINEINYKQQKRKKNHNIIFLKIILVSSGNKNQIKILSLLLMNSGLPFASIFRLVVVRESLDLDPNVFQLSDIEGAIGDVMIDVMAFGWVVEGTTAEVEGGRFAKSLVSTSV